MTQPFVGQIQPFANTYAPKGWAQCDGQILPIAQNAALFSLLGTYYGGNGTTTFALPDLRGRVPVHQGNFAGMSDQIGSSAGVTTVALNATQMPMHSHTLLGSSANASVANPTAGDALAKAFVASGTPNNFYGPMTTPQALNPNSVAAYGQNQPHNNMQPYLAINWCISLVGIFPSRN